MLGAFDPVPRGPSSWTEGPRRLLVHTSPTKRSTDFVALLDQLGAAYDELPPNWWTPLLSSAGSGEVLNGSGTASFYG
jgi:hypothetical protein